MRLPRADRRTQNYTKRLKERQAGGPPLAFCEAVRRLAPPATSDLLSLRDPDTCPGSLSQMERHYRASVGATPLIVWGVAPATMMPISRY